MTFLALATMPDGVVVPTATMDTLDNATAAALNGDQGGTWNPSTAIVLQAATGYAGPVFVAEGTIQVSNGLVKTPSASGVRVTFGDDDYYMLPGGHPGRSRALEGSTLDAASVFPSTTSDLSGLAADQTLFTGDTFSLVLRPHNGATMSSVVVHFKVHDTHAGGVPVNLPKFRVVAVDATGAKTPLTSTASGADANGWVVFTPTPASGAAWYSSGNPQTLTVTCDGIQFAVGGFSNVVQTNVYTYVLEVVEENGTHAVAGNVFLGTVTNYSNIYDMRPQQ